MKNRLKDLRKEHHLTLDQLEKVTGIKRGTLSNYELGKTEPKMNTWQKLADYYNVSVGYIQGLPVTRHEGQSIAIAPFMTIGKGNKVDITLPENLEKEIDQMYKNLPEPVAFGYDVFIARWDDIDSFAFKVPKYLKDAVNWYFLKMLTRASHLNQNGDTPRKK